MAQRAETCFACGAALAGGPRRQWRLTIPWADIILLAVIAGLIVLWWTHPLATASVNDPVASPRPTGLPYPGAAPLTGAWLPDITPEPTPTSTPLASATPLPPSATPTAIPTPLQHKVSAGESVGLIAEKYGVKISDLRAFNNLGSDFILPGQMLKIPGTALPATNTPVPTPTGGTLIYKVQSGDTIAGLAETYGANVFEVLKANNMTDRSILSIGQVILIPLGGATPSPTPTNTPTPAPATFTPGAITRAPSLLLPAENAVVEGTLLLSWTSTGLLDEDEWYVVLLRPAGADRPLTPYWTKTTSWRVPAEYRLPGQAPVTYSWQVQVVRGRPDDAGTTPVPLGTASAVRHFTWK